MNNYRTHLEYEYRQLLESDERHAKRASKDAERVSRAASIVDTCERALEVAKEHYERTVEQHRESHRERTVIRTEIGEVESELFSTAEEQEDWH